MRNNRHYQHRKNTFTTTIVKGVRAEEDWWDKCDVVAGREETSRNELIVRVVEQYCDKSHSGN